MGKCGTDVAKEAADMILVDDNLGSPQNLINLIIGTILYAIEEGKSIYHNIQNFLRFQLSTSFSALFLVTLSTLLGLPNPLNATQILWINIICDGPVAQSLGVEVVDPGIMRRPPRSSDEPIISKAFIFRVIMSAIPVIAGTLGMFALGIRDSVVTKHDSTRVYIFHIRFPNK